MLNRLTQNYCKNNLKSCVIRYMHEVKMYWKVQYANVINTITDKTRLYLHWGVGGIHTKYLSKTRDKMVEKHITKYLKIQINI